MPNFFITFAACLALLTIGLQFGGSVHLDVAQNDVFDKRSTESLAPFGDNRQKLEKMIGLWFSNGMLAFEDVSLSASQFSQRMTAQFPASVGRYGYSQAAYSEHVEPDPLSVAPQAQSIVTDSVSHQGSRPLLGSSGFMQNIKPKPLSLLMNFGLDGVSKWSKSSLDSDSDLQDDCPTGTIFDPFSGFCRPAVCIPVSNPDQPSETASTCSPPPESCMRAVGIPPNATTANVTIFLGLKRITSDVSLNRFRSLADSIVPLIRDALERDIIARLLSLISQETQIRNVQVPDFLPENCSEITERLRGTEEGPSFCDLLLKVDSLIQVPASVTLERPEHLRNQSESIITMFIHLANAIGNKSFHFEIEGLTIEAQGIQYNSKNKSELIIMDASWCSMGTLYSYYNDNFTVADFGNKSLTHIYIRETNKTYRPGEFKMRVILRSSANVIQISQVAHVCERPLNCTAFEAEGAKVLQNRTAVWKNRHYDISTYYRHPTNQSKILICGTKSKCPKCKKSYSKNLVLGFDMRDDLSIISVTLTIISILALFCTLVIYLVFKELRTLPGLNLMNVMGALVVGQMALLLNSVGDKRFCHAIGIITHYAFLLGFFFSNVIAWDIYRTFGGRGIVTERRSFCKQLFGNMAYCYFSSAAIVVAAVILDELDVEDWHVGYATLCWIAGARTSAVFFAAPVALILLLNGTLVAVAFWNMRKRKNNLKGMRVAAGGSSKKEGFKSETVTFVKIGSLFGFMWIFGFAAGFSKPLALIADRYLYLYEIFIYGKRFELVANSKHVNFWNAPP